MARVTEQPTAEPEAKTPAFRWLNPGVKGICLVDCLSDRGHEVATSLLPRLVIVALGASPPLLVWWKGYATELPELPAWRAERLPTTLNGAKPLMPAD